METEVKNVTLKGGEFLIKETNAENVFIPEEWNEEQKMIAQMCDDFLENEVLPNLDRIDALEEGLMPQLMDKAGELGLLATAVPDRLNTMWPTSSSALLMTRPVYNRKTIKRKE